MFSFESRGRVSDDLLLNPDDRRSLGSTSNSMASARLELLITEEDLLLPGLRGPEVVLPKVPVGLLQSLLLLFLRKSLRWWCRSTEDGGLKPCLSGWKDLPGEDDDRINCLLGSRSLILLLNLEERLFLPSLDDGLGLRSSLMSVLETRSRLSLIMSEMSLEGVLSKESYWSERRWKELLEE